MPSTIQDHRDAVTIPIPEDFRCPITLEVFRDPVCTCDGQTYEREAIEEIFRRRRRDPITRGLEPARSPLTNLELRDIVLVPNIALKNGIQAFLAMRPDLKRKPAKVLLHDVKAIVDAFERESDNRKQDLRTTIERLKKENQNL